MKAKILRTDAELAIIEQYRDSLTPLAEIVTANGADDIAALAALAADADVILTCYDEIPAPVIEAAGRLKGIVKYGVGTDNIDIEAATRQGVMVAHCPDYGADTVADHAFVLLAALARRLPLLDRAMRDNAWVWPESRYLGADLSGKTLGVVGYGRIGRRMARRGDGFAMARLACDPYVAPETMAADGVSPVGLDQLLEQADFVSLHCVLTPETRGLIGAAELGRMKETAYLVNVSRGALVEGAALVAALDENRLAGAAFDVFEDEPLGADHPLRGRDNVILTPHLAWYTREAFERVERDTVDAVRDILDGRRPKYLKNAEVLG